VQGVLAAATTLAVAEIGTEGRVVALLAAAQARRAAAPAFAGGIVHGPTGGRATAAALAEEARRRFDAACGLGVGAVRPGPEGRDMVEIVLVGDGGVRSSEHLLGGGPLLATARAAKSALDLVRLEAAAVARRAEAR
jgi:hypothetical protein